MTEKEEEREEEREGERVGEGTEHTRLVRHNAWGKSLNFEPGRGRFRS